MAKQDIERTLKTLVYAEFAFAAESLTRETRFVEDMNADDLDTISFSMRIEDQYDIVIPEEIALAWKTFGDAVDYVAGTQEVTA